MSAPKLACHRRCMVGGPRCLGARWTVVGGGCGVGPGARLPAGGSRSEAHGEPVVALEFGGTLNDPLHMQHLIMCHMIKACADNSEFETPTGLFQALISPAIILLRGRDTGMAHRILDRDDVLTIVQHGRCKGSAKIMWSEFFQPCLNSPGFKNVIDSLVRHSVGGDIIKPPDPLKQSSGLLTTNLIHPTHKPLPSPSGT